jgi:hypothetical protein
MRSRKGRDLTAALGGVMGPGQHKIVVMEMTNCPAYTDVIMKNSDGQLHKERCFGRAKSFYELGATYKVTLEYSKEGHYKIESKADVYELVHIVSDAAIFRSERIRDIYEQIKNNKYKLRYLRVVWADFISKEKEEKHG